MKNYLFMGGPWHSRTYAVPDASHTVKIPIMSPLVDLTSWSDAHVVKDTSFKYAEYKFSRFSVASPSGSVHVLDYYQYVSTS